MAELITLLDSTRCAVPLRSLGRSQKRRPASTAAPQAAAACTTSLGESYVSVAAETFLASTEGQT